MTRFRVEVPATSANLGPGFDTLGLALDIVNSVQVELTPENTDVVLIDSIGPEAEDLDPTDNLLCAGYRAWAEDTGLKLPGARFSVDNQIPIARGLGASAAALVAGLAAGAFAAGDKDSSDRIVRLASLMEGHADNAVAAALGGVTTAFIDEGRVHALHVANHLNLGVGLFVPSHPLLTIEARSVLPETVSLANGIFNVSRVSYLTTALIWGKWELIGRAMQDRFHQPYRLRLLPALDDVISSARQAGAYGAALSGGGPSVIALGPPGTSEEIALAMKECAHERNWEGRALATRVRHIGVRTLTDN